MNAALKGSCLVGMGVFVVFSGQPANAAEGPLLVVVEAPPALDADAAEIRRAIGTELRTETIAPMKRSADPPGRALIVAFDRDRIAMSLRTNDATPIVRDIPAPTDRAARLRAIAWLAGNLARDQVSPIVEEAPAQTSPLASMPSLAITPAATEPPPSPLAGTPSTEPPPVSGAPTVIATRAPDSKPSGPPRWSIGIADGPTTIFPVCDQVPHWGFCNPAAAGVLGSFWRIDVQRRTGKDGFFSGAALEGTAGSFQPQLVGLTAFVGSMKRLGLWSFEASFGAGLELGEESVAATTFTGLSTQGFQSTVTVEDQIRPGLLADASVAVSHPISQSFDAVVRFGAHLSTIALDDWFLTTTLGLRYNIQ